MDVIEILTKAFFGDIWMDATYYQVSGSANTDLVCNMAGQDELAIIPCKLELSPCVSKMPFKLSAYITYPFAVDVNVIPPYIIHEFLRSWPFNERDASTSLVRAQKNIQNSTTTDDIDNVLVCCAVGKVLEKNGSLLSPGVLLLFPS